MTNEEAMECLSNIDILSFRDMKQKYFMGDVYEALDMAIKAIESQRWIPVSERLPKKTGWYFITFKIHGGGYATCEMSYRKPENYWTSTDISCKVLSNDEVIAWKPLPEPYKEEQE